MAYGPTRRSYAGFSQLRDVTHRLRAWFDRRKSLEQAHRAQRDVLGAPRWHVRRWQLVPVFILAAIWIAWPLYSLITAVAENNQRAPKWIQQVGKTGCGGSLKPYCGVVKDALWPAASIAFAYVVFILWAYSRVRRHYQGRAKNQPKDLVPTAGSLISEVVGREQLCDVLITNLRDRASRRPHVLIGGVGSGKTAVLVKLTEKLAGKNVVPVPIKLGDADKDLNFEDMARGRLKELVDDDLISDGHAEKIWRRLRKDDRVVVLADGLEEALEGNEDRNNVLRAAIRRAVATKLPLA